MEKAKFWLVQIVMVAFVSLVFGSPVMAHRDGGHKWSKKSSEYKAYKAEKKDKQFHKKMERKIKKYTRKVAKYERKLEKFSNKRGKSWKKRKWMKHMKRKLARYERKLAWYEAKYEKHMAEKHGVVEEEPVPVECAEGTVLENGFCVEVPPVNTCPAPTVPDGNGGCELPAGCNPFTGC